MIRRTCVLLGLLITPSSAFVTELAQSSPAVVIVAASGGREIQLFDAATFERLATLTVGRGPHEIALSADRQQAFVADAGTPQDPGTTISVVDVRARRVSRSITLPAGCKPHDLRVSRDGSRLWSTCAPARRVVEIDATSATVTRTWETGRDGGWMLIVTPDEQKIYVANLEGRSLSVIDRRTNDVKTIELDGGAMGMDFSPDGRELWVGGFDAARVWVIDAAADRVVTSIEKTFLRPGRIRFLPGRGGVLVQHGGNRLSVVDATSRQLKATLELAENAKCLAVSDDGRRVFIGHPGADAVSVVDLDSMKIVGRFAAGLAPDGIVLAAR
jgi:DNA-binding beta-propeller fold protein YncE